ncbi:DUF2442 domain-containing protein [Rhodohalobacter sulfatireducens]|uniref:DUF2442 domain-containing protein n=1 Tax=Rhodohalobacter sulfatireducens TaxID=2911366 RepID=A0ABS9KIM6_9BACT|nr:DUF2442 domain-containing protein [Rhodohalobacter sulfatireducens]MCG2590710.1 DUF2442 domain-containing protein [Rhodohalobacter sulfatireducens]
MIKKIHLSFSNETEKTIDLSPFIKDDKLSSPLSDLAYFKQAKLYENGREIYWPKGYDFFSDFLRNYRSEGDKELVKEEK